MAKNNKNDDEEMYVELDLDEGKVKCAIITIFEAQGNDYIALQPLNENDEAETGEVWLYGYSENENDPNEEPGLRYIEDDEEYEIASDAFDEYLDNQEFDELYDDDEE